MNKDAIQSDASNTTDSTTFDAESAFLDKWDATKKKPSDISDEDTNDAEELSEDDYEDGESLSEDETDENEDGENDDNDEEESETKTKTKYAEDDAVAKVKVDGKEVEVKVSDLTRLYGQEAALTRKSQEVAALRKQNQDMGEKVAATAAVLMNKAQERFQQYASINWLLAAKELPSDEFTALQNEAITAANEVKYYEEEAKNILQSAKTFRQNELVAQAHAANEVLSDPKNGIPGWSRETYESIREYATKSAGLSEAVMDELVDAAPLKILYKAMMYDKGAKVKTTVVNKAPQKVVRGTVAPSKQTVSNKAEQRLQKSGSVDDAMAAFLNRWREE